MVQVTTTEVIFIIARKFKWNSIESGLIRTVEIELVQTKTVYDVGPGQGMAKFVFGKDERMPARPRSFVHINILGVVLAAETIC